MLVGQTEVAGLPGGDQYPLGGHPGGLGDGAGGQPLVSLHGDAAVASYQPTRPLIAIGASCRCGRERSGRGGGQDVREVVADGLLELA